MFSACVYVGATFEESTNFLNISTNGCYIEWALTEQASLIHISEIRSTKCW